MPKRRERTQETIDRMMDAAAACFAEKGFEGCSISDIAAKAGMSQGSFYVHFTNKEALFKAIIDRECVQTVARIDAATPKEITPGHLADIVLDDLLGSDQCIDPRLYLEVMVMATRDSSIRDTFVEYDRALHQALVRLLDKASGLDKKSERRDHATRVQWLMVFIDGLMMQIVLGTTRNREEQHKLLVDFLTHGLAMGSAP